MTTARFFWRLVLYQRWLYLANCVLWTLLYMGPLLPGLVLRRFFNQLEAGTASNHGVLTIAASLVAIAAGRVAVVYAAMFADVVHRFATSALLRRNLFDRSVPDARLLAALELLGLGPWFQSYPEGLDARISAGALSAGEAQLLACARLCLKDPGLVVLDEATSRLDPATQRLVDGAIARLMEGRTAIIVAHRLATVDRADKIAIIEDGRIVETGSRVALLADRSSLFRRLRELDTEAVTA